MNILEMKQYMKEKKITYEKLSLESGIPLTTIKYIFSQRTENPRIDTMKAIETTLKVNSKNDNFPMSLNELKKVDFLDKFPLADFFDLTTNEQNFVLDMVKDTIKNLKIQKKDKPVK